MKVIILTSLFIRLFISTALSQVNDPLYVKQWALENKGQIILKNISELERIQLHGVPGVDINWVDTKDIQTSKSELIVAVLDSGLDINHPDLQGRVWYDHKLCDNIPNAQFKACNGFNFLDYNNNLIDDIGHGTHVAGIIAANRNSLGIAGAADPRIKIMPLKVMNSQVKGFVYEGKVFTDVIADAMIFAIKNGAEVINLSLGWPKLIDLEKVKAAFDLAEKNNVIVIAASGNNNKDLPTFPCSYENVICVGAIDNRGDLTDFTNFGSKVDITAPGESIVSTYPSKLESRVLRIKNYESKRGSSQAAPYVAAAVANLKLLHPGLTNNQVRNLLFRSSKKNLNEKNNRFVKFGMLDMKRLLDLASTEEKDAFIIPLIKSLTEVKFNSSDRAFSFKLDIKNLSAMNYRGLICLSSPSNAIRIDQTCYSIDSIGPYKNSVLPVTGLIQDLRKDSHVLLNIQIDHKIYQTSLVFSRDLSKDSEVESYSLGQASFNDMALINGERKFSRLSRVFDKYKRLNFPEYFYIEGVKQTSINTVASLITNDAGKFVIKNIVLPKVNRILSIHRQDINLDGQLDYFIYTLSEKKDNVEFFILDNKLEPLFENLSKWSMKLTTFEGLPIDGGVEKFEWLKVKHPLLGSILVPSIYKTFTMPEADNSKYIYERVLGAGAHQFYLNPVVVGGDVIIDLRVVDSVQMMKALQKEMKIAGDFDSRSVRLKQPFPQTETESTAGIIRSLIIVDEDGIGKLFETNISLEGKNFSTLNPLFTEKSVNQSLIYPIINSRSGKVTNEAVFTALLDRSTAEFLIKDDEQIGSITTLKENWENPIISLLGTFEDNQEKTYLVESRNTLTLLRGNVEKASLPIYRDSSFPGQSFAETLLPILSEGRPGLYVNSTLIYGDRLYSMIDTKDSGFIRPLRLSISIPQGCVPLNPEVLNSKIQYNYTFLCTDANKEVFLKFLPMSHL